MSLKKSEKNAEQDYSRTPISVLRYITGLETVLEGISEAAEELLHLHNCEQEGILSWMPKPEDWMNACNKLEQALLAALEDKE